MSEFTKREEQGLYVAAIRKWGDDLQFTVLAEECSEVIKEVMKRQRGYENKYALVEEIADLEIMIGQIKTFWGLKIKAAKNEKLLKLKDLLLEESEA
jgi:NTP pyrophosphatase (non-canonical NTP hydrolase)